MIQKILIITLALCCVFSSLSSPTEARELAEYSFDRPYDPTDPNSPFAYGFFDTTQLEITNNVIGGRLTQVSNPYTVTAPSNPIGGAVEHVKFLQLSVDSYTPGHEKKLLKVTARMGAQHYNMSKHPFPSEYVTRPEDDVRLGSCALNAVSLDTFLVLDFMITNYGIYALYERLPFGRTEDNVYRAFTQIKRVADRSPDDLDELAIQYDANWGIATWFVNDRAVFTVQQLGKMYHGDEVRTLIDLGGVNEIVAPETFNFGFGCFTLLDAVDYFNPSSEAGLVDLCTGYDCGYVTPTEFYDEEYDSINRLWGQGSALTLSKLRVDSF